jgi:outer membrane lipoprotein-sorting protein
MKLLFALGLIALPFFQSYDYVSFEMTQRRNVDGKTSRSNAKFFFSNDGRLVAHYYSPLEFYMINNREGEMSLYNPENNTVFQVMNHLLSSQNNPIYYFLSNKTDDMGLRSMDFKLTNSRLEDGLLISNYKAPKVQQQDGYTDVELVHQGKTPVFIGYMDEEGEYVKKVFYYDYQEVGDFRIPTSITEIEFTPEGDSAIAKTNFANFKFDEPADLEFMNFEVPASAELIK